MQAANPKPLSLDPGLQVGTPELGRKIVFRFQPPPTPERTQVNDLIRLRLYQALYHGA